MVGIESMHIRANKTKAQEQGVSFLFDNTIDRSLADLALKITPLCSAYVAIVSYTEHYSQFEYGMVSQALCAAIRELLKEYIVLVAQLETQFLERTLSLKRLWFFVQPSLATLKK